jgi:hypothetical protein
LPNLIVGHTAGNTIVGGILAVRGGIQTGSPVNMVGSISGGTDATIEISGITPSVAGCMLIIADGSGDDNNRTPPSGFTYRIYDSTVIKCYKTNLGSDGSVAGHTKTHTSGATGNFVDSQAASDPWASVLIALAPTPPGAYTLTMETMSFPFTMPDVGLNYGGGAGTRQYYPMGDSVMQWTIAQGGIGANMVDETGTVVYTDDDIYLAAGTGSGGKVASFTLTGSAVTYANCPMVPWTGVGVPGEIGSIAPIRIEVNHKKYGTVAGKFKAFLQYGGTKYYAQSFGSDKVVTCGTNDAAVYFDFWAPPWPVTGLTNWGVALTDIIFGIEKYTDTGGVDIGRIRIDGMHPIYTPATPNTPDTPWAQTGQNIIDNVGGEVNPTDIVPWDVALSAVMQSNGMGGCKIQVGTDGVNPDMWDSGLLQFGQTVDDDERCPHKHYAGTNVLQDSITYYWRICAVSVYSEDSAWTAWQTFIGVTDPEWGLFVDYHNRCNVRMGTNHSALEVNHTLPIPFQTGFGVKVDTCGMVNESIQHSARQMAYYEGFTYAVYSGYSSASSKLKIFIKKYNHDTKTWSAATEVHDTNQYSDSHYYACILVGADFKLHLFVGGHDSAGCYYRTTGAHVDGSGIDITSWENSVAPTGLSNATYIRPVMDSTGTIYLFFRHDLVLESVHDRGHLCYIYSTDNGANWSARQYVVYYSDYVGNTKPSIYCGGVAIDANDRVHIAICWWEKYGTGGNMGRGISCIYADKSAGGGPPEKSDSIYLDWYEFGTVGKVGSTTTTRGAENVQYADVTKIAICGNPATLEGPFVHTNSEALVVDNLNYPHFVYYSYSAADRTGEETSVFYVYWSGSAWVTVDLYTEHALPKLWKYRHGGQLYFDDNQIHIYGFVKPAGEIWFGGELYHYRRTIETNQWSGWFMSANSGKGIGMISVLPKRYPGRCRELLFSRCEDVIWMEDQPTGTVRFDGADVRIVEAHWNGGSPVRTELDRLPDAFQMQATLLQVPLKTAIAANANAATDRIIQLYYNKFDASSPPHDATKVFRYLENFEGYASNSNLNGQGGWVVDVPAAMKVFSSYDQTNYSNAHTNKLRDGDRYLKITEEAIAVKDLNDTYPGLGADITNVEIIFHIWDEGGTGKIYLELYDVTADKYMRFGFNCDTKKAFYWADDGQGSIDGALTMSSNRYFEYRMIINSSGVSGYVGDTAIFTNNANITVFDEIKIGSSGFSQIHIIDSIRIVKWVASAPTIVTTVANDENKLSPGSVTMAHLALPAKVSSKRQAQFISPSRLGSANQAGIIDPNKLVSTRQAHFVQGDKATSARMMELVIAELTQSVNLAGIVKTEKTLGERITHIIMAELIGKSRLAQAAQGEKTAVDRLGQTLVLLGIDDAAIANIIDANKLSADRQAHFVDAIKHVVTRQAHKIIAEMAADGRLSHLIQADKLVSTRMMQIAQPEQSEFMRFACGAVPEAIGEERFGHFLKADKHEQARIMHAIVAEQTGTFVRLGQIALGDKIISDRLANYVVAEMILAVRQAHAVQALKNESSRIAHDALLNLLASARFGHLAQAESGASERLGHILRMEGTGDARMPHMVMPNALGMTSIANMINIEQAGGMRLGNFLQFVLWPQDIRFLFWSVRTAGLFSPVMRTAGLGSCSSAVAGISDPDCRTAGLGAVTMTSAELEI